jgi:hypothetical protein
LGPGCPAGSGIDGLSRGGPRGLGAGGVAGGGAEEEDDREVIDLIWFEVLKSLDDGGKDRTVPGSIERLGEPTSMPSEPSADFDPGETRRVGLLAVVEGDDPC